MTDRRLSDIHKILVVRNDGIGDLLNSTPAIALLAQNYPDAEMTVLARPLNAPVLLGNPSVHRVLVFDREREHRPLRQRLKFYRDLRRAQYDLVVAMRTSTWSHFATFLSGARHRLGRYHKPLKQTLTLAWRDKYRKGNVHEVDRSLDLVRMVCEGEGTRRLTLNLQETEISDAKRLLLDWDMTSDDFLVGIHPGGSSFDKRWPEANYAQIADRLVRERGAKILILRGPEEAELERNIQNAMQSESIAYAPQSVRALAALLKQCNLVVCNDSGPMHVAAALDVPTVALFGPTDHVVWKPLGKHSTVVRQNVPCWPCSPHRCKIGWECIKTLPVDKVWEQIG